MAAITHAGGSVLYDWELYDGKVVRGGKPSAPKWLVDLIGVDSFGHVAGVEFPTSSTPTVDVFAQISRLTRLEQLTVYTPILTDAPLAHLEGLTGLSHLWLYGTQVSDAGLVHLEWLTKLNVLQIGNTQVSDAGLVHLKGLTNLSGLYLSNNRVTDRGLESLDGLELWTLDLSGTHVTDAGVTQLVHDQPQVPHPQ